MVGKIKDREANKMTRLERMTIELKAVQKLLDSGHIVTISPNTEFIKNWIEDVEHANSIITSEDGPGEIHITRNLVI